jgi:hypothetical protein
MDHGPEPERPAESGVRVLAALIGLVVILVGAALSLYLFFFVLGVLRNPGGVGDSLNQWEQALRGQGADTGGEYVLPLAVTDQGELHFENQELPSDQPTTATLAAQATSGRPLVIRPNFARFFAAIAMLVLLSILIKLAVGLIGAGGRLVRLLLPKKAESSEKPLGRNPFVRAKSQVQNFTNKARKQEEENPSWTDEQQHHRGYRDV